MYGWLGFWRTQFIPVTYLMLVMSALLQSRVSVPHSNLLTTLVPKRKEDWCNSAVPFQPNCLSAKLTLSTR